jgi:hypothetical protein
MNHWQKHQLVAANPPSRRMRDVHLLHSTQSVPTIGEGSVLRRNMPLRNDKSEGAVKTH